MMDDNNLEHFGVKGMRWGVRKKRTSSSRKGGVTDSKVFKALVYDKTKSPFTEQGKAYIKKRKEAEKAARNEKFLTPNSSKFKKAAVKVRNWMTDNEEAIVGATLIAYTANEIARINRI